MPQANNGNLALVTISSALEKKVQLEKDRFKGLSFAGTILRGPTVFPATDHKCGYCLEALESSDYWVDGVMYCRGKYQNGSRAQKHPNTAATFSEHPTKRRHSAKGVVELSFRHLIKCKNGVFCLCLFQT